MNWLRAWFAGRWWESLIKITVIAVCSYVIVAQLHGIGNVAEQKQLILKSLTEKSLWFLAVILLMPFNWLLEASKWRLLMHTITPISLKQSIKSTLMGVSAGVATPWRSGEFIGRLFPLDESQYLNAFYYSLLGGMAQAFVTAVVGLAFLPAFFTSSFIAGVCTGISIALLVAYFNFNKVATLLPRLPVLNSYVRSYSHASHPPFRTLLIVLLLSVLRYCIYASQWIIVAVMLGVGDSYMPILAAVAVSLLLQSIAPALPLLDIAVRSGIALFVFGMVSTNTIAIMASTIIIWMLNLATPALLGSVWILHDGYKRRRKAIAERLIKITTQADVEQLDRERE